MTKSGFKTEFALIVLMLAALTPRSVVEQFGMLGDEPDINAVIFAMDGQLGDVERDGLLTACGIESVFLSLINDDDGFRGAVLPVNGVHDARFTDKWKMTGGHFSHGKVWNNRLIEAGDIGVNRAMDARFFHGGEVGEKIGNH
jgi:hypothetical protein